MTRVDIDHQQATTGRDTHVGLWVAVPPELHLVEIARRADRAIFGAWMLARTAALCLAAGAAAGGIERMQGKDAQPATRIPCREIEHSRACRVILHRHILSGDM